MQVPYYAVLGTVSGPARLPGGGCGVDVGHAIRAQYDAHATSCAVPTGAAGYPGALASVVARAVSPDIILEGGVRALVSAAEHRRFAGELAGALQRRRYPESTHPVAAFPHPAEHPWRWCLSARRRW